MLKRFNRKNLHHGGEGGSHKQTYEILLELHEKMLGNNEITQREINSNITQCIQNSFKKPTIGEKINELTGIKNFLTAKIEDETISEEMKKSTLKPNLTKINEFIKKGKENIKTTTDKKEITSGAKTQIATKKTEAPIEYKHKIYTIFMKLDEIKTKEEGQKLVDDAIKIKEQIKKLNTIQKIELAEEADNTFKALIKEWTDKIKNNKEIDKKKTKHIKKIKTIKEVIGIDYSSIFKELKTKLTNTIENKKTNNFNELIEMTKKFYDKVEISHKAIYKLIDEYDKKITNLNNSNKHDFYENALTKLNELKMHVWKPI